MTQVPMFTSKGCDIGRGDARRVDTQKILRQIKYNFFHLKKFLHKKFKSNKFEPPLKKICVTNYSVDYTSVTSSDITPFGSEHRDLRHLSTLSGCGRYHILWKWNMDLRHLSTLSGFGRCKSSANYKQVNVK